MKVLVYYLDCGNLDVKVKLDAKRKELEAFLPGQKILMMHAQTGAGDRVEVLDLTLNYPYYYVPTYTTSGDVPSYQPHYTTTNSSTKIRDPGT